MIIQFVMKTMKTNYIFPILLLTVFCSCSKWLDVQPETEVDIDQLFSTQAGFEEAIIGVYMRCTENDIYGKELTIGTPEVLAQNYTMNNADLKRYQATRAFDYDNIDFRRRRDDIWKGLYHAIVNCNLILENIDSRKHLFVDEKYHSLIKGEALALRAYLHFDALRLFASSFASNPAGRGIPYVTKYSNRNTEMSTVSAVLDSAIRDLEAAKVLLLDDPIRSAGYFVGYPKYPNGDPGPEIATLPLFEQNRRHRMNYYAVCGTLARIYLYKQDKANALTNAQEVITSAKFPWTANTDFMAIDEDKKDRILYQELIFGWYIPGKNDAYNPEWFSEGQTGMHLPQEVGQLIYETATIGGSDQRYRQWFSTVNDNNLFYTEIHKYRRNRFSGDSQDANRHYLMAPAIRLSEMHYIAAESSYPESPSAAFAYLDIVRQIRGIDVPFTADNEDAFLAALVREYRKELFAEGQLFYTYKRLNRPIIAQNGSPIPASNTVFVLPLPDDEIIYGLR